MKEKQNLCRDKKTGQLYSFHIMEHNSNIGETPADDTIVTAPVIPQDPKLVAIEYATLNLESGCWDKTEFSKNFEIITK